MRVLTFNSHQPYLHLLADSLPWSFGVVTPRLPSGSCRSWDSRIRPLRDNVRLYASVDDAVRDCSWDWVLTHNVSDLLDARELRVPKVFLVHGTLSGRILQDGARISRDAYVGNLKTLLKAHACIVLYISELKRHDWGIPGKVIRTAINPAHYGGYRGDHAAVLQVGNHLRERGAMLGWEVRREVCRNVPSVILGENPGLLGSSVPNSWEELKEYYRSCRLYLHAAIHPFEDGYNLALLEAMATGMPIATMEHLTSPIEDGVQGVVAADAADLRRRVLSLLDDPVRATRMGAAARARVEQAFPLEEFRSSWKELAASLA